MSIAWYVGKRKVFFFFPDLVLTILSLIFSGLGTRSIGSQLVRRCGILRPAFSASTVYPRHCKVLPLSMQPVSVVFNSSCTSILVLLELLLLVLHFCALYGYIDGEPWGIVKPSSRPIQCATSLEPGSQWEHPMIKLEAFGLAHYKLRGSNWTSAGNLERRHAASMYRCAESWLKQLHVGHPDFEFFRSHNPSPQAS